MTCTTLITKVKQFFNLTKKMIDLETITVGDTVDLNYIVEVQGEVLAKDATTLTTAVGTFPAVDLYQDPQPPAPDAEVVVFQCETNLTPIYSVSRNFLLEMHGKGTLAGDSVPYLQKVYNLCTHAYGELLTELGVE